MKMQAIIKMFFAVILVLVCAIFGLLEMFFITVGFHCIELYSMGQKIYLGLVILSGFYAIFIPIGIACTVIYRKRICIFFGILPEEIYEG